ncbi:unnamed protein product [Adineta steineri]|uniref:G-protein coupled receptors family 1 profile domain-containing protein n=2 Tax=Adineta steineri TaxID=433720 RepID=A0A819C619_9BILA|nr:unnamed protein product [Adineta steineri]CAF3812500.1 unnamed protein product [Adineta steineri]
MSNDINLISSINFATMQINRHAAAIVLLFGTIGNVLNVLVLSENSLRKIPCAFYLCWSSVSAVVFLWSGLLTRVLQGYNFNWPNENRPISIWALVGASMDRYLCSSHSAAYRRLSTSQTAKRYLIGIFIFFALVFLEILYCFEASVPNVPVACYAQNLTCRLISDWSNILIDIVFPSICLVIFGALTIRNARARFNQPIANSISETTTSTNALVTRNNDRNLTRMLLVQVMIVLVLDLPFGVDRSYASLTSDVPKSAYRVAIENLSYSIIILLLFFTHTTSFYLYTLTGTLYRAAFKRLGYRFLNQLQARY